MTSVMECIDDECHPIQHAIIWTSFDVAAETASVVEEEDFGFKAWEALRKDTSDKNLLRV